VTLQIFNNKLIKNDLDVVFQISGGCNHSNSLTVGEIVGIVIVVLVIIAFAIVAVFVPAVKRRVFPFYHQSQQRHKPMVSLDVQQS